MTQKANKKNNKIQGSLREDQFVVLLENVRDEIKLVAEGNLMLRESMERGFKEVRKEISGIKNEMVIVKAEISNIKDEMSDMKTEMSDMKTEMRMGFKGMMAETLAIDEKMDKKADKKDLLVLEKRVVKMEAAR